MPEVAVPEVQPPPPGATVGVIGDGPPTAVAPRSPESFCDESELMELAQWIKNEA
jgi:hypothetical protein